MPSSYTSSLRLTLPATGELSGQWGSVVNQGITELLDAAVAGTAAISTWGGAGVAYTLSNNSGLADEARKMFIVATGSPGEAKNVICPAVSKFYVLRNDTTGGFALTLKTPSGVGISVPAGQYKFLYCNGTDVVEMFNSAGALTLGGALSVGGTTTLASNPTLSAGTANQVQFLNASKVLTGSANMTFNGTDLTVSGAVNAGSVNATTLDLTNLEVTNIKAKDGTASASIADSTGVMSLVANPVLSGGTANGVAYANASKVLTTGSALTFDGTTLGVGVVGSAWDTLKAIDLGGGGAVYGTAGQGGITSNAYYDVSGFVYKATNGAGLYQLVADSHRWSTAASGTGGTAITFAEQMRLTSTGLGIGTSSPDFKLVVAGNTDTRIRVDGSSSAGVYFTQGGSNAGTIRGTTSGLELYVPSAGLAATLNASGNLGIGTSSPGAKLDVAAASGVVRVTSTTGTNGVYYQASNTGGGLYMGRDDSDGGSFYSGSPAYGAIFLSTGAYPMTFAVDSVERMRLDSSGNLGIGTSSPTQKLEVNGAALVNGSTGFLRVAVTGSPTSGAAALQISVNSVNARTLRMENTAPSGRTYDIINGAAGVAGNLGIYDDTAGAYRVTLDSSGNLGLGVTPSAWSGGAALDLPTNSAVCGNPAVGFAATFNAYYNSGWKYKAGTAARAYVMDSANHIWYTAPSGTADTAISFTQAMTLDASGNLGVGTTSPSSRIHLATAAGTAPKLYIGQAATSAWSIGSPASVNALVFIDEQFSAERARITSGGDLLVGTTTNAQKLTVAGAVAVTANAVTVNPTYGILGLYTGGGISTTYIQMGTGGSIDFWKPDTSSAARITSGGQFLVGTTTAGVGGSGNTIFTAKGNADTYASIIASGNEQLLLASQSGITKIGAFSTHPLLLITDNTERARITSGGYFKASNAGTYLGSTGAYHELRSDADATTAVISSTNTGSNVVGAYVELPGAVSALARHFVGNLAGVGVQFEVSADGDVTNTNGTYGTISDERLKQDIVDASSQWADIKAIRFRKYRLKQQVARDANAPYLLGVVAQEIEQTSPGLVEDGEVKSVKSSVLLMKAAVALQEALTRIEQLEARVQALETP